jgi:hypothetical protein
VAEVVDMMEDEVDAITVVAVADEIGTVVDETGTADVVETMATTVAY